MRNGHRLPNWCEADVESGFAIGPGSGGCPSCHLATGSVNFHFLFCCCLFSPSLHSSCIISIFSISIFSLFAHFLTTLKLLWNCSETALKLLWNCSRLIAINERDWGGCGLNQTRTGARTEIKKERKRRREKENGKDEMKVTQPASGLFQLC